MDPARLQLLEEALGVLLKTLEPSHEADEARRLVVADMQQLVSQALVPELHCSVEMYGSYRAGLHIPGSDIDFALAGWVLTPEDRQLELYEWTNLEQQHVLGDLADALEEAGLVEGKVERVLHARVPVIKFTHRATGLACDFSINRPECTFKADMQKLWGSLDRRYALLYRLVKAWAAAHGLNDAAANTLNSWSLGLLVAFYLQCGAQPAVLPPIWQLLEKEAPDVREPRVLQLPNVNSAQLKRVFNQASTGAGAYLSRRSRAGAESLNTQCVAELLAGFFEFYSPVLTDWSLARNSSWRASTWWGDWKQAAWGGKQYIFGLEDPFNAGDNTARSVGTHNHLSSCKTAAYIAATCAASHKQLQQALSSSSSSSDSSCSPESAIISAYAWLFGPQAIVLLHDSPCSFLQQLQQVPSAWWAYLEQQLQQLGDVQELLANSTGLTNNDKTSLRNDPDKISRVQQALKLFRTLMEGMGCTEHHVCLGDYLQHRKEMEMREAEERERERQAVRQQLEDQRRLELHSSSSAPQLQPHAVAAHAGQQGPAEVVAAMKGLSINSRQQQQQQQQQPRAGRTAAQQQRQASAPPMTGAVQHPSSSQQSQRRQQHQQQQPSHPQQQQQQHSIGQGLVVTQQQQDRQAAASHAPSSSRVREGRPGDGLLNPVGGRLAASALVGLVSSNGGGAVHVHSHRPRGSSTSSDSVSQAYVSGKGGGVVHVNGYSSSRPRGSSTSGDSLGYVQE